MRRNLALLFCCLYAFICCSNSVLANGFTVVIDAGHGGRDTGAIRGDFKEKDINLAVALELGKFIENNHKDVKVVYTRKTDVFVDLVKRSQIANKAKANLFISVHTNSTAAKTTTAQGADTYILGLASSAENLEVAKRENSVILLEDNYSSKYEGFDPKSPESYIIFEFMTNKYMDLSLQLASQIQSNFKNLAKRQDRGVRQAGFLVLKESSMPSVLVELGFINNPAEAKYLTSPKGQKTMASAIYAGFKKYKVNFDKMQGSSTPTTPKQGKPSIPKAEKKPKTEANKTPSNAQPSSPKAPPKAPPTALTNAKRELVDKKETQPTATATNIPKDKTEYRVQFLISRTKLDMNSSRFKGLSPLKFYVENGIYKYTYGSTTNFQEIVKIRNQVREKFKDCFVVRFINDERQVLQ